MTVFDGQAAGTREQDWAGCSWLRGAPEMDAPIAARLVVVAAHPDDETLGAGGLIGLAASAGLQIHVIFASDGSASHPQSGTHSRARLAGLRRDEAASAVHTLAPQATLEFLALPDGQLAAFSAEIRAALDAACCPDTLLLAPWAYDRHPDHEACARAARTVAAQPPQVRLWEFPIWAWHWGSPTAELAALDPAASGTRRLTLEAQLWDRKQAAIACYPSQTEPLSAAPGDEAVLTPGTLAYFARDCECFFPIAPGGA